MTCYKPPTSPVFIRLFAPLADCYAGSVRRYNCTELTDFDFLEMGVVRCLSAVDSGRDFLQQHGDQGRKDVTPDLFFKGLKSERRLDNLHSVNANIARTMGSRCDDPYASIPELSGFDIYAGDGHFHEAACHDPHNAKSAKGGKKRQTGHFFLLGMRDHHMQHLALAAEGPGGGNEHDMHAIKRKQAAELRCGAPKGRKVITVWDRACIDFGFWQEALLSDVCFISREKENMKLDVMGIRKFDREDPRNAGVVADEFVGPGGGGAMLRRVTYTDPEGVTYTYLTTEMTLPPGIIALLYKQRWDIEKVFDEIKNKMRERKSWASGDTAKTVHATFVCLTHNLMVLLEEEIHTIEGVDNTPERERKKLREEETREAGGGYVATALQRFTVRSVKFVRWLRNFVYREVAWANAIARLRRIYATT